MKPESRFHGWSVVWAAFVLAVFSWGIGFYGPSVYLQTLHSVHGWSISIISGAISVHFLWSAAIIVFLPDLHRRIGIAQATAIGTVLTAIGIAAWAYSSQPWHPYVAAVVSGSGWALTSGATINAIVTRWFDKKRPQAIALAFNGASVGGIVFAPLWIAMIAAAGFQSAALLIGGLAIAVLVPLSLRYLRSAPADFGLAPDGEPADAHAAKSVPARSRRSLLSDARFITLSIPFALALFAQIGLFTHLVARLAPITGSAIAALAVSLATVCAVLGRSVLASLMGDRDRRILAAINFLLQACGVALLILGTSTTVLLIGCVVFGLGVGNLTSLPPLIAQKSFSPGDVGMAVALVTAVNQAVFATAPAILGILRDASGSYVLPFALAACAQISAALIVIYGRRFEATTYEQR